VGVVIRSVVSLVSLVAVVAVDLRGMAFPPPFVRRATGSCAAV
jgi:hypothetical protein